MRAAFPTLLPSRTPPDMPAHSPADLAARPAQYSMVLVQPTGGMLVSMALLLGSLLLPLNALKLATSPTPARNVAGALLGLGLLLRAGYQLARGWCWAGCFWRVAWVCRCWLVPGGTGRSGAFTWGWRGWWRCRLRDFYYFRTYAKGVN